MDGPFSMMTIDAPAARAIVDPRHAHRLCAGHFPDDPLLPGAFLVELMADVGARLLGVTTPPTAVHRCVFHARVHPGGEVAIVARHAGGDTVEAEVLVDGARAAQATLAFGARP